MDTFFKQPSDVLDYDVDFSRWLPAGDTITSATADIDIVGEVTINAIQIPSDGLTVKLWLAGGVTNGRYKVTVHAATTQGRSKEVDFILRVRDC